jgi:hypothetical protein
LPLQYSAILSSVVSEGTDIRLFPTASVTSITPGVVNVMEHGLDNDTKYPRPGVIVFDDL